MTHRAISTAVAVNVIKAAMEEGLVRKPEALEALRGGDKALAQWTGGHEYVPSYSTVVA
jgi:hypothetical protein